MAHIYSVPISNIFTNNNYFSSYIDIKSISAPSNPNSGIGRLYHNTSDGKLYFKTSGGTTVELGGGTLTDVSNVGTGDGDVYRDTVTGTINLKTIKAGTNITVTNNADDITIAAAGGVGEANTASNLTGTAGAVGVFKQKSTFDLEFKKINAGSTKVTIADDTGNDEIDIDVDESALDLANIGGTAGWSQISKTGSVLDDIADVNEGSPVQYDVVQRNGSNQWVGAQITNNNIDASAAIAYSKLDLADSIVAGDITSDAITTDKILDANVTDDKIDTMAYSKLTSVPTSFLPTFSTSYTFTVYDDSGTVKARNNKTNTIDYSDADLDDVLRDIIENSGDPSVEVQSGTYTLSSGLTKITVPSYAEIKMQRGTKIIVPQGYADCVYFLTANAQYITIEGGEYSEAGTPSSDWYVVEMFPDMSPSEEGVLHNRIASINAYQAKAPIHLKTDTTSWINSNTFEDIFANRCKYLIFKEHVNAFTALASGMNVNTFINCRMQAQSSTPQALGGVVGVDGDANNFINCSVWDLQAANASAKSLDISSNARYTTVFGGYLASYNISDGGKWTAFHDKYQGLTSHKLAITAVEATGAGSNEIMATFKVRDDTSNFFQIENGTVTDALLLPQFRFKQYTANNFARIDIHDVATAFDTGTTPFYLIDFRKNNASAITSTTKPLLRLSNFATGEYDFYTDHLDLKNNNLTNAGINLTNNTVTDTSRATGDLIKDNGTKYVRFARGTSGSILKSGTSDVSWVTDRNVYSYIVYDSGTQLEALNTTTNVIDFTQASDIGALLTSVIDAMNTAGGGTAFIKNGLYLATTAVETKDDCTIIGEDREQTIIRCVNLTADNEVFRYWAGESSALLTNFKLSTLKIETNNLNGDETGESNVAWISSGSKNCTIENVWVKSFSTPTTPAIGLFFDTANNTNNNESLKIRDCVFEGDCGGQDFVGSGEVYESDFSNNRFYNLTAQCYGINTCHRSNFSENIVDTAGNFIGFEGDACIENIISDNILYNTTGIKLSGFNTTDNVSRRNSVHNNTIISGEGGIQNGQGYNDTISNNKLIRTETNGIYGSMSGCIIENNEFKDTNWGSNTTTVNSVSQKDGGILLVNNTSVMPNPKPNIIRNNVLVDTGATFTDPVGSGTESGDTGPIVIDTDYDFTVVKDNYYEGLQNGTLVDYGLETINYEVIPSIYENAKVSGLMSELFIPDNGGYGSGIFSSSYAVAQGTTGYDFGASIPSRHYTTGASTGNKGGKTNFADTRRNMLPKMFCKFRMNSTADHALFIGWATGFDYDAVHATTPLNAMMGIGVAAITGVTNFRIIHNDASGACTSLDTGKALDTSFHTIEIWTDDTNWYYNFDNGFARGTISSDMPDTSTNMYLHWTNLTNTPATKKFNVAKMLCRIRGV